MIVEYDENGAIFHVLHDPVPPNYEDVLTAAGRTNFVSLPPVVTDWTNVLDDDGEPVIGDDGEPVMRPSEYQYYNVQSDQHYVDIQTKTVVERPVMELPAEVDLKVGEEREITLPDPCYLIIDNEEHTVTGGVLTLSAEMPASYDIFVHAFPYVLNNIRVTVHEA